MLRHFISALCLVSLTSVLTFSALSQSSEKKMSVKERFAGTWEGTFDGDAAGKLAMNLNPADDGKHTGKISVAMQEGEKYETDIKTLSLEGDKLIVKYTDPNGGEATLEGTSDGKTAQGKWTYRQNDAVAGSGEWKLTKDVK